MADPMDAIAAAADALAAAVDASEVTTDEANTGNGLKKRALELLTDAADETASVEDELELEATTLDDVMVSPVLKKARVEADDEDLNGDDDVEDVAIDEEENASVTEGDDGLDDMDLAPPDASTDEDEEPRNNGNRNGTDADVINLDEEDDEDDEDEDEDTDVNPNGTQDYEDEDEDEDEGDEVYTEEQRRRMEQNKAEARYLINELGSSSRSSLVLTALEKYGADLFNGHEVARDAILVDACAKDTMLGLLKETVRMNQIYKNGTEDAPLEVDGDDEDYDDEEDDDEEDEEPTQPQRVDDEDDEEDDDGEINLLSDEDTDENADSRPDEEDDDDADDDDEDDAEDTTGTAEEDPLTADSATGDDGDESLGELSS